VAKKPGLTSLLVESATEDEVIMKTQTENLDVIPRGPIVVGSTEILCQQRFHDLVAKWRTQYDRIVLDTPPVLGLSETVNLQQVADGVLIAVRSEVTPVHDVALAADNLRRSGAHMIGFILNAVDLTKITNYYDYYYYSADYYYEFAQGGDDEDEEVTIKA
jgi:Mrp family chromosome partitioning ATPase